MINVGSAAVEAIQGDVAAQKADALVIPANDCLWMGSGVAGQVKRKGGDTIERKAVAQGPVAVGSAVITESGKLPAEHVIHAVTMGQDLKADADSVESAAREALLKAREAGVRTLAIADLGSEVGGLSIHLCAKATVDAVIDHLLESAGFDRVQFILKSPETHQAFHDYLLKRFSAKR